MAAGVIAIVAAGGCSRSGLDYDLATADGGPGDDSGLPGRRSATSTTRVRQQEMLGQRDPAPTAPSTVVFARGAATASASTAKRARRVPRTAERVRPAATASASPTRRASAAHKTAACVQAAATGKCTGTETCFTCPADCGQCPGCGDGTCTLNENCFRAAPWIAARATSAATASARRPTRRVQLPPGLRDVSRAHLLRGSSPAQSGASGGLGGGGGRLRGAETEACRTSTSRASSIAWPRVAASAQYFAYCAGGQLLHPEPRHLRHGFNVNWVA